MMPDEFFKMMSCFFCVVLASMMVLLYEVIKDEN